MFQRHLMLENDSDDNQRRYRTPLVGLAALEAVKNILWHYYTRVLKSCCVKNKQYPGR